MGSSTYAKASKNARMMVLEHGKNKGTSHSYKRLTITTITEHSTYRAVDIKVLLPQNIFSQLSLYL